MVKKLRDIVPLTELSKKTLSSYVKKAVYDSGNASFRHGELYGKELVTKKRTYHDKSEGHKLNSTISKRTTGIDNALHRLTGRFNVALKKDPKKFADDGEYLGPLTKSKKYKLKEDRETHMKKHGEKACEYAEKIKKCCEEFCKVAGKYDDYQLKSLARELEDIYERLDNDLSYKKEAKKNQDKASGSTVYEDVQDLDELSKETLNSYIDKLSNKIKILHTHSAMNKRNKSYALSAANDERAEKYKNNLKKAKAKLKEEIETLDELSKETLKSYIRKASAERLDKPSRNPEGQHHHRVSGLMKAKYKAMNKEEVVDEGKFSEFDIIRQEKEAKEKEQRRLALKKKMQGKNISRIGKRV